MLADAPVLQIFSSGHWLTSCRRRRRLSPVSPSSLVLKTGLEASTGPVGVSLSFGSGVFIPSLPNDPVHFDDLLALMLPPLALFLVLSL